jgi:hypothetical protein
MTYVHVVDPLAKSKLPTDAGVYWLVAVDRPFGDSNRIGPRSFGRLSGQDTHGNLYIGSAKNVRDRAGDQLIDTLVRSNKMTEWSRWYDRLLCFDYFHSNAVSSIYPLTHLAVKFEVVAAHSDAVRLEQLLYYNYRQANGELPPFNRDFTMKLWISAEQERNQRGPLQMPTDRYWPETLQT